MKKIVVLILFLFFALLNSEVFAQDVVVTDYSKANNWISKPAKQQYLVDIFYIYPTACQVADLKKSHTCDVNHEVMRAIAKNHFANQAMAFDTVGDLYAPFYAQVDARIFENSVSQDVIGVIKAYDQEMSDIYGALDYFFENINKGRPFILASHSQGSAVMTIILSDYMKKHPDYYERMIAAYPIGFPYTKEYRKNNPHVKFAKGADDIGVVITYNTQAPDKSGPNLVHEYGQYVINPINWKRNGKYASKKDNLGSLVDGKIVTPGIADAKVDKKEAVVVCSTVDASKNTIGLPELFGEGSFHGKDYQFYFLNIRENAKNRVNKYFSKKK